MARRDVVVIGASAGGVEALRALVSHLPADLPATLVVVLHTTASGRSALPAILTRAGVLPAHHAQRTTQFVPGQIIVAPADHHVVVYDHAATLSHGPRENGHRPAIDVLFRTAARSLGPRVIGIVLSGALDDGAVGLAAISARGGRTLVQDPGEALVPAMPLAAIRATEVDHVAPVEILAKRLIELVREEVAVDGRQEEDPEVPDPLEQESQVQIEPRPLADAERVGVAASLSCPDCFGTLNAIEEGDALHFRCRVGHAWSPESLVVEKTSGVEGALWVAVRTLEEKATLADRLARRATERGHAMTAERFDDASAEAMRAARDVRALIDAIEKEPGASESALP